MASCSCQRVLSGTASRELQRSLTGIGQGGARCRCSVALGLTTLLLRQVKQAGAPQAPILARQNQGASGALAAGSRDPGQEVGLPPEPRAGPSLLSKAVTRLDFEPFAIQKSQYCLESHSGGVG